MDGEDITNEAPLEPSPGNAIDTSDKITFVDVGQCLKDIADAIQIMNTASDYELANTTVIRESDGKQLNARDALIALTKATEKVAQQASYAMAYEIYGAEGRDDAA